MTVKTIANRYRVEHSLGEGAIGTVYLARDSVRNDHLVAVKVMKPERIQREVLASFKREFDAMTRLKHPNLVRVYDFGIDRDQTNDRIEHCYISMEYIDGDPLQIFLQPPATLSDADKLSIMVALCRAVDFIHSRGIIHRDLKPENIMILKGDDDLESRVRVMDFGLADLGAIDHYRVKGTLPYLAPEVLSGIPADTFAKSGSFESTFDSSEDTFERTIDQRVDIYALGMTFYNCLTQEPFNSPSDSGSVLSALQDPGKFKSNAVLALNKIGDSSLRRIIGRMTAFQPNLRYAHAAEVIADLNRLMGASFHLETERTRTAWLLGADFVGRKKELSALKNLLEEHSASPSLTIVRGAIGIGKSRLFLEFKKSCQLNEVLFLEGSCFEQMRKSFGPFLEILSEAAVHADEELITRYGPELKKLLPFHRQFEHRSVAPFQDPRTERFVQIKSIGGFLVEFCNRQRKPVVVSINDLHWIDEASLDVIKDLLSRETTPSDDERTMILCANVREEEISVLIPFLDDLAESGKLNEMHLRPFRKDDIAAYLEAAFGKSLIAESLIQSIPEFQDRVGGNPFFLQEMMKSLVDHDVIARRGITWDVRDRITSLDVPDSLKAIITRRLERQALPRGERKLLQTASLLTGSFTLEKIRAVIRGEPLLEGFTRADDALSVFLERLDNDEILIAENADGVWQFRFAHDLFRDVIASQVADPASQHLLIGRSLEQYYREMTGDRGGFDEFSEELVYHFTRSLDRQKARHYLLKAANRAKSAYAGDRALALYAQFVESYGDEKDVSIIDVRLKQREIAVMQADWPAAELFVRDAIERSVGCGDQARRAQATRDLGDLYYQKNDYDAAVAYFEQALELFTKLGNPLGIATSVRLIGCVHWRLSSFDKARECAEQSLSILEYLDEPKELSYALKVMADVLTHIDRFAEAITHYERFQELCRALGDKQGLSTSWNNLGVLFMFKGDLPKAADCYHQALALYQELGVKQGVSIAMCNIAETHKAMGDLESALEFLNRAIDIGRSLGVTFHLSSYLIDKARILCELGQYEEALALNDEGLQMASTVGRKEYCLIGRILAAQISVATATEESVIDGAVRSLRMLVEETEDVSEQASLYFALWEMTSDREDARQARRRYRELAASSKRQEFRDRLVLLDESIGPV